MTVRNRLLLELSETDRDAVIARSTLLELRIGDVIQEVGSASEAAYFPESGLGSIVAVMEDGTMTEAASVGMDGFLGATLLTGTDRSATRIVWQVPGAAYRLPAADFRELLGTGTLTTVLLRSLQCLMDQMTQVAGCNRRHQLVARAARWLLMTDDRVEGPEFRLTHEFLATMIGADRPRVTLAARSLQQAGLLTYHRGVVRILDRTGLEDVACECYTVIARMFPGLDESGRPARRRAGGGTAAAI